MFFYLFISYYIKITQTHTDLHVFQTIEMFMYGSVFTNEIILLHFQHMSRGIQNVYCTQQTQKVMMSFKIFCNKQLFFKMV